MISVEKFENPSIETKVFQPPFKDGQVFYTQHSKFHARMLAVARVAFSCILLAYTSLPMSLSASMVVYAATTVGFLYAGWTIYSHILSKDPLLEVFYKVLGTKDAFEKLPTIKISGYSDGAVCKEITRLKSEDLKGPVTISSTQDGRRIILVKDEKLGLTAYFEKIHIFKGQKKGEGCYEEMFNTAFTILFDYKNNFNLHKRKYKQGYREWVISSFISSDRANLIARDIFLRGTPVEKSQLSEDYISK